MGKTLIIIGLCIVALGILVWLGQYLPESLRPFHLPGDIRIERDGVRFYFPITTMILFSLLLSAALWLLRWWQG